MALLQRGGVAAAAAALLSFGAGAGVADASPKSNAPVAVKVTSPAANALVTSKRVPVRLKVGPKVTAIKVFAGPKDVTRRFARNGAVYTAQLPRTALRPGANTLVVQTVAGKKDGAANSVKFIVDRPAPKTMMSTFSGAKAAARISRGPASAKSYQPTPGTVPVAIHTRTPMIATLKVNGHKVADLRAERQLKNHDWIVSVADGLRVGRNAFLIDAYDAKGRHTVKRWTVNRDGKLPLAEAGPREIVVRPRKWTGLDGSQSRATRRGAKLTYAWRVVGAPKGAKPALTGADSATPRLKADKPGVYQVALRLTQATPGAHAAAAAASEDVVTVSVTDPAADQGLYVATDLLGSPDRMAYVPFETMYISGQPYNFTAADGGTQDFVQFSDTTLAVVASGTEAQVQPTEGTITVGTWQNSKVAETDDAYGSIVYIGEQIAAINSNPTTYLGDGMGNPAPLRGWIQAASGTGKPTWIGSDMLQVKTRGASDTATTNTMEVNGQTYAQTLPPGAQGGFHLVVLDNNGYEIWNKLYPIVGSSADDATEDQLSADMTQWWPKMSPDGVTLLLQGFGTLTPVPTSGNLGNTIQNVGGRADVVSRLNGKADSSGGAYALIAGNSSPVTQTSWSPNWRGEEASFERDGASGSLSALLVRDPGSDNYIPYNADGGKPDPLGQNRYDVLPWIYAAPTPWSSTIRNVDDSIRTPTAAEQAAFSDIAQQVQDNAWTTPLCPTPSDAIRQYYCDTDPTDIQTLQSRVADDITYSDTTANGRYGPTDFGNVKTSLNLEMGDVANVRSGIKNYQGIYGTANLTALVNAPSIGTQIVDQINKTDATTSSDELAVISAVTDMLSVIPGAGPVFTFLSGSFSLASTLTPNTNPAPALDNAVEMSQTNAAGTITTAVQTASANLSQMGDYMVQDPVKLQKGSVFFAQTNAPTTSSTSAVTYAAEYGMQQYLWGTMLAPAYTEWVGQGLWAESPWCQYNNWIGHPFENLDANGVWPSGIGVGANNSTWYWLLGIDNKGGTNPWGWVIGDNTTGYLKDAGLPPKLTDQVFGAINPNAPATGTGNVGAVMPYFGLQYLPIKFIPAIPYPNYGNGDDPVGNGCMKG